MINREDIDRVMVADVYDVNHNKIGSAGQVYVDERTGEPQWVSVRTGMFGKKESFAPLNKARLAPDGLELPYDKMQVKDAPRIEADRELTPDEVGELYTYYGLDGPVGGRGDVQPPTGTEVRDTVGDTRVRDTGTVDTGRMATGTADTRTRESRTGREPAGVQGDEAMIRSEERLNVSTRDVETGKARLRKYVVTEQQQVTVPVTHEEVRIEREPITEADRVTGARGTIGEEEREVTLHAERPVVETETVAVEKVRLDTETVSEQETVSGQVRKEEIEAEAETESPESRRRPRR
jgi:uncharacterized protein (TIGR02271 family)